MSTTIKATDTGATYTYQSDGNFLDDVIGNSGGIWDGDAEAWAMTDEDAQWWMEWVEREEAINRAWEDADEATRAKAEQIVSDYSGDFEDLQQRECKLYGIDYYAYNGTDWRD